MSLSRTVLKDTTAEPDRRPGLLRGVSGVTSRLGLLPGMGDGRILRATSVVIITLLISWPLLHLGRMTGNALFTGGMDILGFLGSRSLLTAARNSLGLGIGTVALTAIVGIPLTWLITVSDLPGAGIFKRGFLIAYLTPSFIFATAFLVLFGTNGPANSLTDQLLGVRPFDVFTFPAVLLVVSLWAFPFVYLIVGPAFASIDPALEEACRVSGATVFTTVRKVVLPLARPAIVSALILVFVQSITLFGVPLFLGAPGQVQFLTLSIYRSMRSFPAQYDEAAIVSVLLLIPSALIFMIGSRISGRGAFAALGTRGGRTSLIELNKWPKRTGLVLAWGVFGLAVILPGTVIIGASVSESWTAVLDNVTLSHLKGILTSPRERRAIINSIGIGIVTGVIVAALSLVVAYIIARGRGAYRSGVELMANIPLAVPGISLAVGFVFAYTGPPLRLYGTVGMFVVAYVTAFLPLAVRAVDGNLRQIDVALEEAAWVSGSTWMNSFRKILVPLLQPATLAAFILVFIPVLKELTIAAFVARGQWVTMPVRMLQWYDAGAMEQVAAFGVIFMAIVVGAYSGLTLVMSWFAKRRRNRA